MTDLDDDELTYPSALDVASWRREVHALYAAVRAEPDPATASSKSSRVYFRCLVPISRT